MGVRRELAAGRARVDVTEFLDRGLFDGYDLVEPGVVSALDWRPRPGEAQTSSTAIYGGVGRL
ncbi:SAM-dependent methyltransferase [Amycolatopsis sulphurea]|uniref:SAM-dependent methyltransferase n=1 Tax=Amycolatopsis sulphurea TaxID=76022 RepID=UPI001B8030D9|nr:SAM-dependent methyltransferase [Amycolatopsis sulphurea]